MTNDDILLVVPMRYAIANSQALNDPQVNHACFRVLATISSNNKLRAWQCPTNSWISTHCGINIREVMKHIHTLTLLGYLSRDKPQAEINNRSS